MNLRDSILYAMDEYSENVVLVFDGNVIAGTRAKKMQARSFNAFQKRKFSRACESAGRENHSLSSLYSGEGAGSLFSGNQ